MARKKTSHRWRDLRERKLLPTQLEQLDRDAERQGFLEGLGPRDKTLTDTGNNDHISWPDKHLQNSSRGFVSKSLARDFAALRNNPTAWQEEEKERAAWDSALADDLEDD